MSAPVELNAAAALFLETTSEAVGWVEADGTLHAANDRLATLLRDLGAHADQPIRALTDLPVDAETRLRLSAAVKQTTPTQLEVAIDLPAGRRLFEIRLRGAGDGRHAFVVRDDTERWYAQAEVLRFERLRIIGSLVGGLVHDASNLLTMALAALDAQYSSWLEPEASVVVDGHSVVNKLVALTHGIGQMLRSEPQRRERVSLTTLAEECAGLASGTMAATGHCLELDLETDLPAVRVVRTEVEQVVLHLLLLVRDACPNGGAVRLATRAERCNLPGTPQRLYGVLEVSGGCDQQALAPLLQVLENQALDAHCQPCTNRTGLQLSLLALHRSGGRLRVTFHGATSLLALVLPT